jgi:enoyl-CoA hydratase/carnithine racemase
MTSNAIPAVPDLFSIATDGEITTLKFLQRDLAGVDLGRMQMLWTFLDNQEEQPSTVLVFELPHGLLSAENVDALLAAEPEARGQEGLLQVFENLSHEETSQAVFAERIINLDCFTIAVIQGEIDLAFLGPVLCCDFQIASEDTVIVNRLLSSGLPSMGGMVWFLVNRLGFGVARKLIWSEKRISATEAQRLGLVSEVALDLELDTMTWEFAEWFASVPRSRLRALKALLNATNGDLRHFIEQEQREINRCLGSLARKG